jgi:capsular exopolysaccharide synthesis family protein
MSKVQSVIPLPLPDAADLLNPASVAPARSAPTVETRDHPRAHEWRNDEASEEASAAYCRLAAQLHQVQQTRALTTILVASAVSGEGKSLTAANLALSLSEAYGKRVALIDADMRRPSLHALFGTASSPGLNDCLAGTMPACQVRISSTLSLLPAGSPEANPLERLSSSRLRALLAEQAKRCDWVIIDAPPLAACPDAGLIANLIDGVVLVVRAGHTALPAVESAIQAIGRERIIGVILNRSTSPTVRYRPQYPPRKG